MQRFVVGVGTVSRAPRRSPSTGQHVCRSCFDAHPLRGCYPRIGKNRWPASKIARNVAPAHRVALIDSIRLSCSKRPSWTTAPSFEARVVFLTPNTRASALAMDAGVVFAALLLLGMDSSAGMVDSNPPQSELDASSQPT